VITESKISEFFCIADDFCKIFNQKLQKYTLKANLLMTNLKILLK